MWKKINEVKTDKCIRTFYKTDVVKNRMDVIRKTLGLMAKYPVLSLKVRNVDVMEIPKRTVNAALRSDDALLPVLTAITISPMVSLKSEIIKDKKRYPFEIAFISDKEGWFVAVSSPVFPDDVIKMILEDV